MNFCQLACFCFLDSYDLDLFAYVLHFVLIIIGALVDCWLNSNLSFFFHANTQQGEAKKALQVLQKPNVPTELQVWVKTIVWIDLF